MESSDLWDCAGAFQSGLIGKHPVPAGKWPPAAAFHEFRIVLRMVKNLGQNWRL